MKVHRGPGVKLVLVIYFVFSSNSEHSKILNTTVVFCSLMVYSFLGVFNPFPSVPHPVMDMWTVTRLHFQPFFSLSWKDLWTYSSYFWDHLHTFRVCKKYRHCFLYFNYLFIFFRWEHTNYIQFSNTSTTWKCCVYMKSKRFIQRNTSLVKLFEHWHCN